MLRDAAIEDLADRLQIRVTMKEFARLEGPDGETLAEEIGNLTATVMQRPASGQLYGRLLWRDKSSNTGQPLSVSPAGGNDQKSFAD